MKPLWFSILLLFVLSQPSLAKEKSLTLGSPDEVPMVVIDHLSNLLTEVFQHLDTEVNLVQLPASRSIIQASNGVLDGEAARMKFEDGLYPNLVRVNESIISVKIITVTKSTNAAVKTWNDLLAYRVGILRGLLLPKLKLDAIEHQQVTYSNSHESLMKMLKNDRIDIIVSIVILVEPILSNKEFNNFKTRTDLLETHELYTYLNIKHADLAKKATKILIKMKADGSYDALVEKYKYNIMHL